MALDISAFRSIAAQNPDRLVYVSGQKLKSAKTQATRGPEAFKAAVDAFVKALRKIYKGYLDRTFPLLQNYAVSIPPGGRTDALVQTVITWQMGDRQLRTRGLEADQTEAAIKATIKMLNIVERQRLEQKN